MKEDTTWIISVAARTPLEAERYAAELEELTGVHPVEIEMIERDQHWLECYVDEEVPARLFREAFLSAFPDAPDVMLRPCKARDWTTFWRHHFTPLEIGTRWFILPEWMRDEVETPEGRERILINPGLSFGTGSHFTTRFCLEMIEELEHRGVPPGPMLDAGCGSAILSIAARKRGWGPVLAVDIDDLALGQAEENLDLNGIDAGVELRNLDITREQAGGPFPVVVANIYGALLLQIAPRLRRCTSDWLVLSGIRSVETEAVANVYHDAGFDEILSRSDPEWSGLLLRLR
jgi:ribosomal protein L11 methyltransferase